MDFDFVPLIRWLINAVRRRATTPSTATTPGSFITTSKDINDVPAEILQKLFSFLTIKEKFICERVCRRWQQNIFCTIDKFSSTEVCSCNRRWSSMCAGLHYQDNEVLKRIILKCGKNLRLIQGFMPRLMVEVITRHCEKLKSIDMEFDDFESLQLLCDQFGKQLKSATVYIRKQPYYETNFRFMSKSRISQHLLGS